MLSFVDIFAKTTIETIGVLPAAGGTRRQVYIKSF